MSPDPTGPLNPLGRPSRGFYCQIPSGMVKSKDQGLYLDAENLVWVSDPDDGTPFDTEGRCKLEPNQTLNLKYWPSNAPDTANYLVVNERQESVEISTDVPAVRWRTVLEGGKQYLVWGNTNYRLCREPGNNEVAVFGEPVVFEERVLPNTTEIWAGAEDVCFIWSAVSDPYAQALTIKCEIQKFEQGVLTTIGEHQVPVPWNYGSPKEFRATWSPYDYVDGTVSVMWSSDEASYVASFSGRMLADRFFGIRSASVIPNQLHQIIVAAYIAQ